MNSRIKTALVVSVALLAVAPALNIVVPTVAHAQAGAADVQAMITNTLGQANAALGASPAPAAVAAAHAGAVQSAVVAAIKGGAPAPALAAAVKAAAASGAVTASAAMSGMAQAAAQIAADPTATPAMKAAAAAAMQTLSEDAAFMAAVAASGGLNVRSTGATGGPGLFEDGGTVVTVPPQFDPCDNIQGDYC